MSISENALNLELLLLNQNHLRMMGEVKDLAIFESSSTNFNPKGLFSTEIFGRVGSEDRTKKFGYIDLRIKVFHPLIYKHIVSLKKLYENILLGKVYAKFDNEKKIL